MVSETTTSLKSVSFHLLILDEEEARNENVDTIHQAYIFPLEGSSNYSNSQPSNLISKKYKTDKGVQSNCLFSFSIIVID